MVYDKKPVIKTLDCVSSKKTSAVVKCQYENAIFWGGECGLEYGYDNNKEKLVVFPTDDSEMIINLTELTSDKEYSYRAYYEINGKKIYGDYKSFSTEKADENNGDDNTGEGTGGDSSGGTSENFTLHIGSIIIIRIVIVSLHH